MKLRHIVFTILIFIIMLILGNLEVNAAAMKTHFYHEDINDVNESLLGTQKNFSTTDWYTSYNIFCLKSGKATPTNLTIDGIMKSTDGKNFDWKGNSGGYTNEQIAKILYVYSTLQDDIADEVASRTKNWESVQQHAIWTIIGQQVAHDAGKNWKNKNINRINTLLAEAEAYYDFWLNDGGNVETKIDTSNVDLQNDRLGPFKLNFYQGSATNNGITSIYGGIEEIKLVSSENLGGDILCYSKEGGNVRLSNVPTPNADLYINVAGININNYDSIRVTFNDGYIRNAYLIKGHSANSSQQTSMYGYAVRYTIPKTEKFKLSTPFEITVKKTDMNGNNISGSVFGYTAFIEDPSKPGYLMTVDNASWNSIINTTPIFKVNGIESVINELGWRKFEPEAKIQISNTGRIQYMCLVFNEEVAPAGYELLKYPIAVLFKQENKEWKLQEIGKAVWDNAEMQSRFESNTGESVASFADNVLTIKNKKNDELTFNIIKKGRNTSGIETNLAGVKFKITTPEKTVEETTDSNGNISIGLTYDGTSSMADGTTIKIEEISTIAGYKKLPTPIEITLKKVGENWKLKRIEGISASLYTSSEDGDLGTLTIINEENDGGGGRRTEEAGGRRPVVQLEKMK